MSRRHSSSAVQISSEVLSCFSPNCWSHCQGGGWEETRVLGGGTLIGVKNYKSLVKSGENVHWATLHCLQLPGTVHSNFFNNYISIHNRCSQLILMYWRLLLSWSKQSRVRAPPVLPLILIPPTHNDQFYERLLFFV